MMSALYVILILNPVFAFTPFFCVRYLVENQQISIFYSLCTRPEVKPMIYSTLGEHDNHFFIEED
jgi:hypothetical protein